MHLREPGREDKETIETAMRAALKGGITSLVAMPNTTPAADNQTVIEYQLSKAKKLNLDLASEYLLMATWLTYLKSKLLLPEMEEDEFKVLEVAEKLKLQLKKLELIRILSDQMLKRKRLGINIFGDNR